MASALPKRVGPHHRAPRPRSSLLGPVLVVVGVIALQAAWIAVEPPFGSPDEESHYSRAVSLRTDGLLGEPVPGYGGDPGDDDLLRRRLAVVEQEARLVRLPPGFSPAGRSCFVRDTGAPVSCVDAVAPPPPEEVRVITPIGTYPPLPYLLGAAATYAADGPVSAAAALSVAAAVTAAALVGLAVAALHDPAAGGLSVTGIGLALTPMALYLSASPNPSGLEIVSAVTLTAGALRLSRDPAPPVRAWVALAAGGAVLANCRSVSPAWVLVCLGLAVLLGGGRSVARMVRARPRPAAVAAAVLVAGGAAAAAWTLLHRTETPVTLAPFPESLRGENADLVVTALTWQPVAAFGYLDWRIPPAAEWAWWTAVVVLLAVALLAGTARHRLAVVTAVLAAVVTTSLLQAAVLRPTGFGVQGRHVLPVLVVVPLLAGEALLRCRARLPRAAAPLRVAVAVVVGAVHVVAVVAAARRAAVGVMGPWSFLAVSAWDPPPGWVPWLVVAVAGAAALGTGLAVGPRGVVAGPAPDSVAAGPRWRARRLGIRG